MKTYARLENMVVVEIILRQLYDAESPDWVEGDPSRIGQEIPIELRFHPSLVANMVDITDLNPQPQYGWVWDGASFAPYVAPPPSSAEIIAANTTKLQAANQLATAQKTALTNRIGTLNDAIELEMATPEEVAELPVRQAQLLEWKRYAVFLGRVTTRAGWALTVEWPVQPTGGMDLTTNASAPQTS